MKESEYLTHYTYKIHLPKMHGIIIPAGNEFGGEYYEVKVSMRNLMHLRLFRAIQKVINRIVLYFFLLMFGIWSAFPLGYVQWKYRIDLPYAGLIIGMIIVVLYMVIIEKLEAIE